MPDRSLPDPNIQLVTVFQTSDPGLAGVVKSILESAGIDHSVKGETLSNMRGWGGPNQVEFQVREPDAQSAALLLAKLS